MSVTRTTYGFLPPLAAAVVVPLFVLLLLEDELPQPAARSAAPVSARSPILMCWSMHAVRLLLTALLASALPVGHSVQGRALAPVVLGSAPPAHRLLVVGCIHGNEPGGLAGARALARSGAVAGAGNVVLPAPDPRACAGGVGAPDGTG